MIGCVPVPVLASGTIESVEVFSFPNGLANFDPAEQAEDAHEAKQDGRD
jgi:hypothetical protein